VVDACAATDALLGGVAAEYGGLVFERSSDAAAAIDRVSEGVAPDVVLLSPRLDDPVRVAQRLHSLDRQGAVVILVAVEREDEVRHALEVAPFLDGDVVLTTTGDAAALGDLLADAARRTRERRKEKAGRKERRDTPPPLSARYLGTLLDSAPIGIVTLDAEGAVIGWNRRAGEMLDVSEVEALGMRFEELWEQRDRARLGVLIDHLDTSGLGGDGEIFDRGDRCFEVTGARFGIRSGESGTLLVLQDVSSRMSAERQLRETAQALQESLLPPQLPEIDGVELAARFRPAGAGMQVGGDFYDVFDCGENDWCIAVGDVCGKGAAAASLTALTRYTVRAAAGYEETAGGVLGVLNRALLHQRGDFRFTTLAFCALDLSRTPAALRLASGGHPRPLLLRSGGSAHAVGAAGPLLGVVPDAEFGEEEIALADGDVIVLYTDGLTDAHAPERMLGERDLLAALEDCAGLSAGEVALHMERVALGDAKVEPRDDIAILVAKFGA
jgi:PAS domain S-box-containing protein